MSEGSSRGDRSLSSTGELRIRVLHLVQNLNYGGMERILAEILRNADADRFDMHVMALEYLGRFSADLPESAGVHLADPLSSLSMVWPRRLSQRIREISPDVVHTHSGVWHKGTLAARMAGVPLLVHTEHGRPHPDRLWNRFIDGLGARRTDVVVAVSRTLADHLAHALVRDPTRIRVVPNGVDTERFRPHASPGLPRELALPPGTPLVGSVGRLEPVKAYDVMIRAFELLLRGWSEPVRPALVLVGDGSERAGLEMQVEERGLGDAVHLLGWRDDVPDVLSALQVFSLSSRSEGTSVSLLEAMAAGVCPVVSAVGGTPAVLGETLSHRLVPPGEPETMATAWATALADPEARLRDGKEARRIVEESFSLRTMVSRYEALYARGLSEVVRGDSDEALAAPS